MPIYEFLCLVCGSQFQSLVMGAKEEEELVCPQCQGMAQRIFHSTPVIFKGSGFYVTDSRKGKEPETGKKESEASKGEKGK